MKIKKTSKNLILTTISLSLCGVFLVSDVFAADIAKSSSGVLDFATMLRVLSDLFSRFWIVIANIVGRLMTNSFVYGEAIYFDGFLWKIWQITRNIANFGLGFIFLYEIIFQYQGFHFAATLYIFKLIDVLDHSTNFRIF